MSERPSLDVMAALLLDGRDRLRREFVPVETFWCRPPGLMACGSCEHCKAGEPLTACLEPRPRDRKHRRGYVVKTTYGYLLMRKFDDPAKVGYKWLPDWIDDLSNAEATLTCPCPNLWTVSLSEYLS
jgi:hypothetical protein